MQAPGSRPSGRQAGRALTLAALLTVVLLAWRFGDTLPGAAARFAALGPWGPLLYVGLYVVATVAFLPGSILTMVAGVLFGLGRGVAVAFAGASLGASVAFLISRYLARELVVRRLAAEPRMAALDRAVAAQGRRIVFLLRLSPVVPFNLLNYALGVTGIRFRDYLAGCLGMLPAAVLYVYAGSLAGDVAALAANPRTTPGGSSFLAIVGVLATAIAVWLLARAARRALEDAIGSPHEPTR